MIRRLLWFTLGAVLGVTVYRRAAALARSLPLARHAGALTGFAADVREGMALYMERHPRRVSSNLESQRELASPAAGARPDTDEKKDGR